MVTTARLISILLLLVVLLFSACDSNNPENPKDFSCPAVLERKDLTHVKECMIDSWKVVYFKGSNGAKQNLNNTFMQFTETDSVYYFREGSIEAESPFTIEATPFPTIFFTNWKDLEFSFEITGFSGDSLLLAGDTAQYALIKAPFLATFQCELFLREKALNQIRHCIKGSWTLHYRFGGFSGSEKTYYSPKPMVNFMENDSIKYFNNGSYLVKDRINWSYDSHWHTYAMSFKYSNGFPWDWGVEQIRQDTLVLFDLADDGYGYYLTKN